MDEALGRAHRRRATGEEALDDPGARLVKVVGHLVDEADAEGLVRAEALAGQEVAAGRARADAGDHERGDHGRHDAEPHLGEAEDRVLRGHRDVRARDQAGRAAQDMAVDASDDGRLAGVDGLEHPLEAQGVLDVLLLGELDGCAHPFDVGPCGEAGALAVEHDGARVPDVGERPGEPVDQRRVERVSTLGACESHPQYGAVPRDTHRRHRGPDRIRPYRSAMRIVVCGAGATGASIAYHLALAGAGRVVLCDRGEVAGGATAKAFGGVRQQFSTAAEVKLAQASVRFFEELGEPLFLQVGYLFMATTEEGLDALDERRALQEELGVPIERVDARRIAQLAPGLAVDDVLGGVLGTADGLSDPPAVCREVVRRAVELGVELREHTDARELDGDVRVIACGPWSAELAASYGVDLPVRPLRRQLILTEPVRGLPERLPLVIEAETGFHFRRRDDRLLIAMVDPAPRWGSEETVDESVLPDRMARLGRRYPPAAGVGLERAWAGLYDMTPDAHPIIDRVADGVVTACGFSGHGFMQSPAVGRAVAELVLGQEPSFDLTPYRLDRFALGAVFPEQVVL